jgi:FKBP-type peptidyl-prolyl cis-trans isomerase
MKHALTMLMILSFSAGVLAAETPAPVEVAPAAPAIDATAAGLITLADKVSYCIGYNIGASLRRDKVDVNPDVLLKGLTTAVANQAPVLTPQEMQAVMQEFGEQHAARRSADLAKQGVDNLKASTDFLEANKAKPGVVTLPSGLQYEIVAEGTGVTPKATDTVVVDYKGTLVNGEQFDSSYDRGEPAEFGVGDVIPGWSEALQLMKVGSRYKLYIPPSLAYGDRGAGPIGPNQALIFEVELKEIKAPEAMPGMESTEPLADAPAVETPAAQ